MAIRNVLLIDESRGLLDACKTVLNGQSQRMIVRDSRHAVELLEKNGIDVVVLSSSNSDSETLESIKKLRASFPSSSYVLAAQEPTSELILTAFRSGINDVVKKPIDPCGLFASICRFSDVSQASGSMMFNLYHLDNTSLSTIVNESHLRNGNCSTTPNEKTGNAALLKNIFSAAKEMIRSLFRFGKANENEKSTIETLSQAPCLPNGIVSDSLHLFAKHIHKKSAQATAQPAADLNVYFFGHFHMVVNGQRIDKWCSHKAKLLFAYILINRKRTVSRDVLMDRFWPNSQPESSRNCLNVAIHSIRQTLHRGDTTHEYVLFEDECYYINPDVEIRVDVEEFMRHWQQARGKGEARIHIPAIIQELELAKDIYSGDFMEEDIYDEWASMERENLKEVYLAVLDRLSDCYLLSDNAPTSAQLCETILERDNCREDIHRRLMFCYYRMGCRDKALRQFKKCTEILKAELEVEPTKTTRQLYEEIRNDRVSPSN